MKKAKTIFIHFGFFTLLTLCSLLKAGAQRAEKYDLGQWLVENKLENTSNQEVNRTNGTEKSAISTSGVVWLKGVVFKEGTIEIDLRGRNIFQQSFLGIAFDGLDTSNYEVVYFRPFNFQSPDTLRKKHTVQYMSLPDNPWYKLREKYPLVYENAVHPFPGPEDWFHVTIVVQKDSVQVYVDHSIIPSLKVHRFNPSGGGKIGLWGDEKSGDFANLEIKK
jgi:hypothetical protein